LDDFFSSRSCYAQNLRLNIFFLFFSSQAQNNYLFFRIARLVHQSATCEHLKSVNP